MVILLLVRIAVVNVDTKHSMAFTYRLIKVWMGGIGYVKMRIPRVHSRALSKLLVLFLLVVSF